MPLVNDIALVNDPVFLVNDATVTVAPPPHLPILQVSFDSDPFGTAVWTDISEEASDLRIVHGRQQELDAFQPGTINGPLDNSDRRFDPRYAAGPYYGKLLPRKRVRVQTDHSGSTFELGSGYLHGWPQGYQHPEGSTTELSATDGFLMLSGAELPASVYEIEVRKDNPHAWWRLGESAGTKALDSSGNGYDGTYVGGATFNTRQGLIEGDDNNAIEFDATRSMGQVSAALTSTPFWVEMWIQVTPEQKPTADAPIYAQGDGRRFKIYMRPDGKIGAQIGSVVITSNSAYADGKKHHIVLLATLDTVEFRINRETDTPGSVSGPTDFETGPVFIAPTGHAGKFLGIVDEVATYDYLVNPARFWVHYDAATKPWDGDTTGARVNKILDLAGWPGADRDVDTGNSTLGPAHLGRRKALDYLQLIERTEQGAFWIKPGNVARFRERRARFYDTRMVNVQFGLTDEDIPGAQHYEGDLELSFDETLIYNEVTVRWDGGEVTVSDSTSIDKYGRRTHSVDTIARTADDARWIGEWILDHYKEPQTRVPSVTVNPGVDDDLWPVAITTQVGDRISLRRLPQGIGDAYTIQTHVEGKEHVITTDNWRTTLLLSQAETKNYWILGSSALGVDTSLGY